jgi:hypothetical protein
VESVYVNLFSFARMVSMYDILWGCVERGLVEETVW